MVISYVRSADYAPASICSLQPKNDPEEVNRFIEMMDLEDIADATIRIRSAIDGKLQLRAESQG